MEYRIAARLFPKEDGEVTPNRLVFTMKPKQGIKLHFGAKTLGFKTQGVATQRRKGGERAAIRTAMQLCGTEVREPRSKCGCIQGSVMLWDPKHAASR